MHCEHALDAEEVLARVRVRVRVRVRGRGRGRGRDWVRVRWFESSGDVAIGVELHLALTLSPKP